MSVKVRDLITEIESAESRLSELVSHETQPLLSELSALDSEMHAAFESLLTAHLDDPLESRDRALFLTSYIKKLIDHGGLAGRVIDKIEEDVSSLAKREIGSDL